jgi:hypothetical protein
MRSALPYYVIGFILLFALFLIFGPRLTQGSLPGQVNEIIGPVEVKPAAGKDWRPLQLGEQVNPGDSLRTGKGAVVNLYWYGGSKMRLGENTQLVIKRTHVNHVTKRVDLQAKVTQGKIWARTRKPVEILNRVEITASDAVFAVKHGTLFSVELQPETRVRLEVYAGRCEVAQGQARAIIERSETAVFSEQGLTEGPQAMTKAERNSWLENTQITGAFITLLAPREGEQLAGALLSVSGYTDPGNTVQIIAANGGASNQTTANADAAGIWSGKIALTRGETELRVTAFDEEGHQSTIAREVSY